MSIYVRAAATIKSQLHEYGVAGIDYSNGKDITTIVIRAEQAEAVIEALQKQIPIKPRFDDCCVKCNTYLKDDNDVEGEYCPNCGQRYDWEDKAIQEN